MGYRGKVVEQERARGLRAEGMTLHEIATALGVAKSSVSLWVRDVEFEARPRPSGRRSRRPGPHALHLRKLEEIERLQQEGVKRIGQLSEREFLMAGTALYAGEGAKTDGSVVFANSSPLLIMFFCAWLRRFFNVEEKRLRVRLYLHQGLDLEEASSFWSEVTGIPRTQFGKPYRAVPDPSIRTAKHVRGCATVGYSCSATHRAVMGLVHALFVAPRDPG
ncbi:MAG: helix-turn-helix domain-containing protein [Egibacteraceae bacterium]